MTLPYLPLVLPLRGCNHGHFELIPTAFSARWQYLDCLEGHTGLRREQSYMVWTCLREITSNYVCVSVRLEGNRIYFPTCTTQFTAASYPTDYALAQSNWLSHACSPYPGCASCTSSDHRMHFFALHCMFGRAQSRNINQSSAD